MLSLSHRSVWSIVVFAGIALLAACSTPVPTPTAVPTEPPTSTPVPPTATPAPTDTPEPTPTAAPKPRLENLRFSTTQTLDDSEGDGASFAVGVPSVWVAVDYRDLPPNTELIWRVQGGNIEGSKKQTLSDTSGTALYDLFGDEHAALPGEYLVIVRTKEQALNAAFSISVDSLQSGDVIVSDQFNNNALGWDLSSSPVGSAEIADGKLKLAVNWKDQYVATTAPIMLADFDLTVDVLQEKAPRGSRTSVWFGPSLALDLFSDGSVIILDLGGASAVPLMSVTRSPAYRPDAANQIRLVARDEHAAVYLNDTLIGSIDALDGDDHMIAFVASTLDNGDAAVSFDNLAIKVPPTEIAVMPTPTPAPAATRKLAGTPAPTAVKQVAQPPLRDAIIKARDAVEAIGGAMDRIYHGGGGEACAPFMANYLAVSNSPTYDVSAQPANVQGAYAQYRQAVEFVPASKISLIANICQGGGGTIGNLDFNEARQAVNTAGGVLTQALATLGQ
jgi:hypothetical protein